MGFIKGTIKVISNVATLGGASRLEEAQANYQTSYAEHEKLCAEIRRFKEKIEANVSAIGASLKATRPALTKCEKVLKTNVGNKSGIRFTHAIGTIVSVQKFQSDFNSAIGIGAGTIAGSSLAVGSWALVGALGSASTGAAISGLSGAAATNATLAWFGGGALAAGGAGVSGGMAVLGGIVAAPLIAIASYTTHKKASEIQDEKAKLDKIVVKQKSHLDTLPDVLKTTGEKRIEIVGMCDEFRATTKRLVKIIRPFGMLSVLKQKILVLFRQEPLKHVQTEALDQLNRKVADFVGAFHRKDAPHSHENVLLKLP